MRRLAVVLGLLACACFGESQPVRYFDLGLSRAPRAQGPVLPALDVPDFDTPAAFDHLRLVLRHSEVEVARSRYNQWNETPGRMLAAVLRAQLEDTGRFAGVGRASAPPAPYVVNVQVVAIELIAAAQSYEAHLSLQARVREARSGEVVWSWMMDERRSPGGPDVADGVQTLRTLFGEASGAIATGVAEALQARVASQDH